MMGLSDYGEFCPKNLGISHPVSISILFLRSTGDPTEVSSVFCDTRERVTLASFHLFWSRCCRSKLSVLRVFPIWTTVWNFLRLIFVPMHLSPLLCATLDASERRAREKGGNAREFRVELHPGKSFAFRVYINLSGSIGNEGNLKQRASRYLLAFVFVKVYEFFNCDAVSRTVDFK